MRLRWGPPSASSPPDTSCNIYSTAQATPPHLLAEPRQDLPQTAVEQCNSVLSSKRVPGVPQRDLGDGVEYRHRPETFGIEFRNPVDRGVENNNKDADYVKEEEEVLEESLSMVEFSHMGVI